MIAPSCSGAEVRRVSLLDRIEAVTEQQIVDRITRAVTPQARMLAFTWVHSSTGLKLPMAAIAEAVREVNRDRGESDRLLVGLDGGFGMQDVTDDDLGCDFFMAGCHKWMFGPRGIGIGRARPEAWARLRPMIPSLVEDARWNAWIADSELPGPTTAARMTLGDFNALEHQWALSEAFAYHREIKRRRRRHAPSAVVGHLAERNLVATITPYAVPHARTPGALRLHYGEEIDAALREIRALA